MSRESPLRWKAVATYRTANGPVDVEHFFEELEELHDLIEAGPDWNALVDIRVTLCRVIYPGSTIEDAEAR